VVGLRDDGGGPRGSVKGGEFLAVLSGYWLLGNYCSMAFVGCNCL
jgi:hypothetical protein